MARNEADREDLLREATALVERIELTIAGFNEPIVCGFRRDGSASFYFGGDPVYQFNAAGQLRRAFVAGRLLKAERGRLIALRRQRSQQEIALVRDELAAEAQAALLADLGRRLERLEQTLQAGDYSVHGEVPPGGKIIGRVSEWLKNRPSAVEIAAVPNVR
jgi:hypothetical protein